MLFCAWISHCGVDCASLGWLVDWITEWQSEEAKFKDVELGDELRLARGGNEVVVQIADFPGDRTVITVEPALPVGDADSFDEDLIIHGIDEKRGGEDARALRVGWHIDGWEILEIVRN